MESAPHVRGRGRGGGSHDAGRQPHSRNRQWVAGENGQRSGSNTPYHSDGERWERGGHRGGRGGRGAHRGRGKFSNVSLRVNSAPHANDTESEQETIIPDGHMDEAEEDHEEDHEEEYEEYEAVELEEPPLDTLEEREKFYQGLVKARELERKKAIAEGKMDDPNVPKRLEDAISVVGTCLDMCPRFERYRRERENNLFEWETIPGTKRVDHKRAVKMYERAAGDKTLPSDLRPPHVLKRTLDYLFHDLLPRGGFSATFNFIRDRSRAVRNDFTMQHSYGAEAIECHDRCARFHILALHFERDRTGFSIALEEQQLMNTLQSLKEFYEDQRGRYESPTELEMRVYHRLIHIRDQKERHEDIPENITSHPVFKLTTDFRLHVQRKSAPISKTSKLVVDAEGMQIFGNLANVLREQGSVVMIYLVACILERLFGKDAIDDIEAIRGGLSIPDIIDGVSSVDEYDDHADDEMYDELLTEDERQETTDPASLAPQPTTTGWSSSPFGGPLAAAVPPPAPPPVTASAFSTISTTPNVFNTQSAFGASAFPSSSTSVFGVPAKSVFGVPASVTPQASTSAAAPPANVFGSSSLTFPAPASNPPPATALPTTTTTKPTTSIFASSLGGQPNPFNVVTSSSPSTTASQAPPSSISRPSAMFGDSHTRTSLPSVNGLSSSAATSHGPPATALNPAAVPFMPKLTSTLSDLPSTSSGFPLGGPFQRSSSPSPSPLPSDTKAPPTPAPAPISASSSFSFPPSSTTKKISPPATQRTSTTPPILPKINTDTSSSPFRNGFATPTAPPPLGKHQPISLPSTPSINAPTNPMLNFIKGSLGTPISSSGPETLSPLFMSSPTTTGRFPVPEFSLNGRTPSRSNFEQSTGLLNGKGKSRAKTPVDEEELENKSTHFIQRSTLVRSCFHRWHERIIERATWIEACNQSDAYQQKIKHQRQSPAMQPDKKRRMSAGFGTVVDSPVKKRARRRVSSIYRPPQTDEELAQRFKENHKEHERRWAQGSFLKVITNHVKTKFHGTLPHASWRIWLSTNPESDATAIWLERKFDVPASGDWVSEAVFSIPLTQTKDPTISNSPGIIVFESTPLTGVTDDLERKYRILDDCTRLRDIVNAFPANRHFVPSLLVISWVEEGHHTAALDFVDMVNKLVESHSISSYHTFSVTSATTDLDEKLGEALNTLSLDLDGNLVRSLTIRGAFKTFEPAFTSFISEWIENCSHDSYFDWYIFGQIVHAAVALMDTTTRSVLGLISEEPYDTFPAFDSSGVTDNSSAYDHIIAWLSAMGGSAENIALNLQTHRDIGQDFPAREFLEQLWDFTQSKVEMRLKRDPRTKFYILISDITVALEAQRKAYEPHKARLGKALHMSVRRSPKRSVSVDTELTSSQSKRRRLSSSIESSVGVPTPLTSPHLNGDLSPSPTPTSISLTPSEGPAIVTVAMLRALTRDIKSKYAGSG
ncbi:SAC3/GANP/Nin1/mts3/eIF-3 p25 family-domain-containing protein [Lyophyllum atratum]|nr:SAC3/GANP/Nin1/mts3/eIF-3 p25 family-domain-containing protein [Lyophyllum atratum]